jgi:short-subunit dehydrogenase
MKRDPKLIVHIRRTDLANHVEVDALVAWLESEKIEVDFLINNAGLGDLGPFATIDPARLEQILNVNMVALTVLTRRLLPAMMARKGGAILNVSSSAGFLPMAGFAVYAASKAYVTSFSEALRVEVRGKGVHVSALCPGPVQTEFMQVAQRAGKSLHGSAPDLVHVSPGKVVSDALAGVQRNQPIIIPGFLMKLGMFLARLTPMPILRLASRASARHGRN